MQISDSLLINMIVLSVGAALWYFATRDGDYIDVSIITSVFSAITAWLVAAAILGEFASSPQGAIIYAELGIAFAIWALIMSFYATIEVVVELIWNKLLGRVIS